MLVTKGIEVRLYPTKAQANMINKNIGAAVFAYNQLLHTKEYLYRNFGVNFNPRWQLLKEDFPWLAEVDSRAINSANQNMLKAYNNWFKKLKKGIKEGHPKYKKQSKRGSYTNTSMPNTADRLFRNGKIFIPMLKETTFRNDSLDTSTIKKIRNLTIKRSNSGKYFCSICCDCEVTEHVHTGNCIGIDLGIKDLVICSDGTKYNNPKHQYKAEKRLKKLQKDFSKKKKGSKNREKARLRLAIGYEKLANKRKDNLHKVTNELIRNNDIICIENLNVKGMTKNHKLAKAIQDASFGMLVRMLKYKALWNNRQIIEIGRFYPSSKTCSCCGHRMKYMGLKVRSWTCSVCNVFHDRDVNAAKNILNEGLRILDSVGTEHADFKLVENSTMDERLLVLKSSSSVKQENRKAMTGEKHSFLAGD